MRKKEEGINYLSLGIFSAVDKIRKKKEEVPPE